MNGNKVPLSLFMRKCNEQNM